MKTYTIPELYNRYTELRTKLIRKKSWNKEAVSYEINLERIKIASLVKLNDKTVNETERSLLLQMVK